MVVLRTVAVAFAMFSAVPVPQFNWTEKNMRYAMCAFPLIRGGHRAAVVHCAACPCRVTRGRRASAGRSGSPAASIWTATETHRHFRATATGKKLESWDLTAGPLRCVWRAGLSGPVRLCTVHPQQAGCSRMMLAGAGTGALRLCSGGVPHGKNTGLAHACLGSRQSHCTAPVHGPSGRCTVLRHAVALDGWALVLATHWLCCSGTTPLCKQFGGITGDTAGWFLKTGITDAGGCGLACQWGELL